MTYNTSKSILSMIVLLGIACSGSALANQEITTMGQQMLWNANVLARRGNLLEAAQAAEEVIVDWPDSIDALSAYGFLIQLAQDNQKQDMATQYAIERLVAFAVIKQGDTANQVRKVVIESTGLCMSGDFEGARNILSQLRQEHQAGLVSIRAADMIACSYAHEKSPDKAVEHYRKVIELAPASRQAAKALRWMGQIHSDAGQNDEASKAYTTAVSELEAAISKLVASSVTSTDNSTMTENAWTLICNRKQLAWVLFKQAESLTRSGDKEAAQKVLQKLVSRYPYSSLLPLANQMLGKLKDVRTTPTDQPEAEQEKTDQRTSGKTSRAASTKEPIALDSYPTDKSEPLRTWLLSMSEVTDFSYPVCAKISKPVINRTCQNWLGRMDMCFMFHSVRQVSGKTGQDMFGWEYAMSALLSPIGLPHWAVQYDRGDVEIKKDFVNQVEYDVVKNHSWQNRWHSSVRRFDTSFRGNWITLSPSGKHDAPNVEGKVKLSLPSMPSPAQGYPKLEES